MAELNMQESKIKCKYETDGKFSECSTKTHVGTTCSVCHKVPAHSRTYYGHLFCIECFYKYIWTPTKSGVTCSGEVKNEQEESYDCQPCETSTSK